ncbi:unnamed protein product [Chrysodeixis includens]|uniref:Uncharacterized protein n=1 Tax=Chrysodeixis includens TaxID=689277 RepID=A0A9P0FUB8_CHRIL|nr:unnamed protein product [Chrysodeixis includens]
MFLFLSTASTEDNSRPQEVELPKISHEALLMDRLTQEHQTYPPDLLSFPLRGTRVSPAGRTSQETESPIKSPSYGVTAINPAYYSRFHNQTSHGSIPLINSKGYVTLPRRPRMAPDSSLRPQVFSTLNGVIPYYDTFNMRFFNHGGNYYSLNKSEMDLGPVGKIPSYPDEDEPAPSPAPGTPHATIPRNSLSSPNIHNQLLTLQAMSVNQIIKSEQRPLKVTLAENEGLLKSRDFRSGYSVNVVSGTLGRSRTAPKPPPKPRKKNSSEVKEPFLMNTSENATQV